MMRSYGIIAYIPGDGFPQDDEAHFDGWYADRSEAQEIFKLFVQDYPTALVHLVERLESKWGSKAKPKHYSAEDFQHAGTLKS